MNWLSKKFTFVIIPDANQSVQRFRLSGLIIILLPITIALLAACAILFFLLLSRHASVTDTLKNQLAASALQYEQQLSENESHISELQTNLVLFSEQAHAMENKMVEISELESQLKQLAGIDTKAPVSISSLSTVEGGQGGEELPLPEEAGTDLILETSKQYADVLQQMDAIIPQLQHTKKAVVSYQEILQITPTIWPTDSRKVTSLFGIRTDPFTGRATYHSGFDIGGNTGDPIYAAADGIVTLSERDRVLGINVMIDHGRGISTRYLHLHKNIAEVGDKVKKGQVIGELGSTGRSTGPHLHYEVSINGKNVDPVPYIKADRKEP
ncbi:M23 family metallopeptidase [Paenibacillus sp. PL91]|uniref:M23 family metallopeptidase n=1 Tax=Paenibacillus sp. PL91 TaxID=2729538 RepID=UPI00145F34FA|nr:M23 family metallopeptidase [Paenibacillus sp. PL91]MBC9203036.1 peptidoglycan DD-metalloendopeptidase family protein [Paenibacillus sp. PL91]